VIHVAVVGAGHWGPNLIRTFHNKETSAVRWVVDQSQGRLDQIQARFPEVQVTTDAARVFADAGVDAVVIATPTSTHFTLAKAALEAGKHVLCEKPIATRGAEGDELGALAKQKGLVLAVGHVFLYNGAVRRVKQYLDEGHLGSVHYISMVRTNLGPIRMDVNAAWDLASHDISIASYWLGSNAVSVSALGHAWINKDVEDAVFATLRYPNDVLVNVHASWLNPRKNRDVTVVGDRRMLTFDDMNMGEPIRIYDKQVTDDRVKPAFLDTFASFRAQVRDGDVLIPKVALGEPLKAECDHFLDCIKNQKEPITSARQATDVVRVLEAMERSAKNAGREEKV
jgi:predicted dehydrogenase